MLEGLKDLPPGLDGLKATGKVTKEDYERVFEPLVDGARREGRRLQFVRDHHRKVKRVALAADSKLASLLPHLGEHFVKAEVKSFAYDELESAIEWAGTRAA